MDLFFIVEAQKVLYLQEYYKAQTCFEANHVYHVLVSIFRSRINFLLGSIPHFIITCLKDLLYLQLLFIHLNLILYTYMILTNFVPYPFLVTSLALFKFLPLTTKEVQWWDEHSRHLSFNLLIGFH